MVTITESFQEMFNFISQASQANFDAEYERLAKQKEIAIKFAGDSDTAKEEIEKEFAGILKNINSYKKVSN